MTNYFIYGVTLVGLVSILTTVILYKIKDDTKADFETRKIRFAAVTFTGILTLILFTSILAFASDSPKGVGYLIFEKVLTALSPVAGGIIGYLFSAKEKNGG
ncbi:hypothetical protein OPW19_17805 [Vibrio europaeus]|uniref:hypothetical protein n=1 Tax=Vibrio europaeus TaxID=300876 RepID=UPI00233F2CC9|nr:hypothetical protein [Vibrio europaeus]MDC5821671.1 hypothetical protein [Vibrio europaeus]MDC5868667.1 hypothetical protein [Vibrio europaeus]